MDPRSRPRRSPSDSSGRVVCFSLRVLFLPFWYLDAKGGEEYRIREFARLREFGFHLLSFSFGCSFGFIW